VITPTWKRHELLLNRCIPSVQAQAYPKVEHVIVSDGPDPELTAKMIELKSGVAFYHTVQYLQLPQRAPERHWGHYARLAGIEKASGDLICYIDDDDSLRPDHIRLLAALFDDSTIGWAYGVMESHSFAGALQIGHTDPPCSGQIGTPMIMHRRETLAHGTWGPASATEDWELVQRWIEAGIPYGRVREPTVDVWPSVYWG
jgi:glycosyltransferase involved in cell wall biosynthesis